MTDPWVVLASTVLIIAASAFFVSVEFAVIASRRPRLEEAAASSRSARAALRSASEVSVLLAGCQLGITACTLALGAVTKPAVDYALEPVLTDLGLPTWLAGASAFALALLLVTFLHLVVGEMAPKSWAIAHPERSATMLALPMRAFMALFRPVLVLLNNAANALVLRVGVDPVDEVSIEQDPDDLRQLVQHSAEVGDLDERSSRQLGRALDLSRITVRELRSGSPVAGVPAEATVADVQAASRASGHLRILVGPSDAPVGLVHVRDTLSVDAGRALGDLVRPVHELDPDATVLAALSEMRLASTQLAVVRETDGTAGVLTMADLLGRLFPDEASRGTITST